MKILISVKTVNEMWLDVSFVICILLLFVLGFILVELVSPNPIVKGLAYVMSTIICASTLSQWYCFEYAVACMILIFAPIGYNIYMIGKKSESQKNLAKATGIYTFLASLLGYTYFTGIFIISVFEREE